jgi:feruloyl esterase
LLKYVDSIVKDTFGGDANAASQSMRLFMMPGVQHCFFGPGPDLWDRFGPIKQWVEENREPDTIIAQRKPFDLVTNERPLCPYPQTAVYTGPAEYRNDPLYWHAANFECRDDKSAN